MYRVLLYIDWLYIKYIYRKESQVVQNSEEDRTVSRRWQEQDDKDVEIWMWIEDMTWLLECFYRSRILSAEHIDMRIARMSLCGQTVQ